MQVAPEETKLQAQAQAQGARLFRHTLLEVVAEAASPLSPTGTKICHNNNNDNNYDDLLLVSMDLHEGENWLCWYEEEAGVEHSKNSINNTSIR